MQLHEQLEEVAETHPAAPKLNNNVVKPSIGRNPIKLFSCMSDQDEAPRLIPKPKKYIEQPDSRLVYRRGSANQLNKSNKVITLSRQC